MSPEYAKNDAIATGQVEASATVDAETRRADPPAQSEAERLMGLIERALDAGNGKVAELLSDRLAKLAAPAHRDVKPAKVVDLGTARKARA